jgi:hypothetical protein
MISSVYLNFLSSQEKSLALLARSGDRVDVNPYAYPPESSTPNAYLIKIRCRSAVKYQDEISEEEREHLIGVSFPPDYQRKAHDSSRIVTLLSPDNIFHPNIMGPMICLGQIAPATPAVEICTRVHEVLTCQRITMREDDALNGDACQWARHTQLPLACGGLISPLASSVKPFSFHLEQEG